MCGGYSLVRIAMRIRGPSDRPGVALRWSVSCDQRAGSRPELPTRVTARPSALANGNRYIRGNRQSRHSLPTDIGGTALSAWWRSLVVREDAGVPAFPERTETNVSPRSYGASARCNRNCNGGLPPPVHQRRFVESHGHVRRVVVPSP